MPFRLTNFAHPKNTILQELNSILKQYWGFDKFRPQQAEIIQAVLSGHDVIALLPTGGGKSLCFQVPAMAKPGLCLVISPLIALMQDQVDRLNEMGIPACNLSGSIPYHEMNSLLEHCVDGKMKFLYLSPERLSSEVFRKRLAHMPINLLAIDEAHCLSQWGYDFRPAYLRINEIRDLLPANTPCIALTASATKRVVKDIEQKLLLRNAKIFKKSFLRDNLALFFTNTEKKKEYLLKVAKKNQGSGIVYVSNRKDSKAVADFLLQEGISADYYHAGLSTEERQKKQLAWLHNRSRIMVCTNAFGMGIDKADVRFVVHLGVPSSPEAYYQEAGRAGRDGNKSFAVALFHQADLNALAYKVIESFPAKEMIKQVYHCLGNYYSLAYGSGRDVLFPFDLLEFAKQYKLPQKEVFYALEILKQADLIYLNEAYYQPARVMFTCSNNELYDAQVNYPVLEPLIKLLLRSYAGMFDSLVKINESFLAKKINMPSISLQKQMHQLAKLGLIEYHPASDVAKIGFVNERLHPDNYSIPAQAYEERKVVMFAQAEAMKELSTDKSTCRFALLCAYFGEENLSNCGICDNCLAKLHEHSNMDIICEQILAIINHEAIALSNLKQLPQFSHKTDLLNKAIQWLLEQEKIQLNKSLLLAPKAN